MKKFCIIILFFLAAIYCSAQTPIIQEGYTDKSSYRSGDIALLYLSSDIPGTIDLHLYGISYPTTPLYTLVSNVNVLHQVPTTASPWEDGYGYQQFITCTIPSTIPSGYYMIENKVPIIIKGDNTAANNITIVCGTNTINAYTGSGGASLYIPTNPGITTVSFHRPQLRSAYSYFDDGFLDWVRTWASYPLNFISDADMDKFDQNCQCNPEIANAKLLIVPGHSEYWTRQARVNFDRFVDGDFQNNILGRDALILSGNTMWMQVRYEDESENPDDTKLTCYRGAHWGSSSTSHWADDPILSTDPLHYTCHWGSPFLKYSIRGSLGSEFVRGGYGNLSHYNGFHMLMNDTQSPLLANTNIQINDVVTTNILYEEYDGTLVKTDLDGRPLDANGNLITDATTQDPELDMSALGFYRAEIIGYDYGEPCYVDPHVFNPDINTPNHRERCYYPLMVFKKTSSSGTIINTNTTRWCSYEPPNNSNHSSWTANSPKRQKITENMISLLMTNQNVFSNSTLPNFITVSPAYTSVSYSACSGGSITFTPHGIYLDQAYKIDNGYTWREDIWVNNTGSYFDGINGNGLQPYDNSVYNFTLASVDNNCTTYQPRVDNSAHTENDYDNDQTDELKFSLYPNPTTNKFIMQMKSADAGIKDISIYTSIGTEIFHLVKSTAAKTAIDLSAHPKGIYFVKVTEGEKTGVKKIVLM
jgi:hypothetical protein